jgi:hypothetical protein
MTPFRQGQTIKQQRESGTTLEGAPPGPAPGRTPPPRASPANPPPAPNGAENPLRPPASVDAMNHALNRATFWVVQVKRPRATRALAR